MDAEHLARHCQCEYEGTLELTQPSPTTYISVMENKLLFREDCLSLLVFSLRNFYKLLRKFMVLLNVVVKIIALEQVLIILEKGVWPNDLNKMMHLSPGLLS